MANILKESRPPVDLLDWLLFPLFLLAFLGVLIFFDLVQRLALLFGETAHQWSIARLNRALIGTLRIVGTKIVRDGEPPYKDDTPCIVVSNHQSLFDIPLLATSFPWAKPRYVAKQELGKWIPSVSLNLRRGGSALIDRRDPRQAIPAIKALGARLTEKRFGAVIFPEGTRARFGELKQFHPAGLAALIQTAPDAKIIPVVIDGTWRLSAYSFGPIPRNQTIRVRYLAEVDRNGRHARVVNGELQEVIRQNLEALRGEPIIAELNSAELNSAELNSTELNSAETKNKVE